MFVKVIYIKSNIIYNIYYSINILPEFKSELNFINMVVYSIIKLFR